MNTKRIWLIVILLLVTLTYVSTTIGIDTDINSSSPEQIREQMSKDFIRTDMEYGYGMQISGMSEDFEGRPAYWMGAISSNKTKVRGACVLVPDMQLRTRNYADTRYVISFSSETMVNSTTGGKLYIFGFVDNTTAFGPAWFADADNVNDYETKTVQFISGIITHGIHTITIRACTTDFETEGILWYKNMNVMVIEPEYGLI